jgi:hypothetical protein
MTLSQQKTWIINLKKKNNLIFNCNIYSIIVSKANKK